MIKESNEGVQFVYEAGGEWGTCSGCVCETVMDYEMDGVVVVVGGE